MTLPIFEKRLSTTPWNPSMENAIRVPGPIPETKDSYCCLSDTCTNGFHFYAGKIFRTIQAFFTSTAFTIWGLIKSLFCCNVSAPFIEHALFATYNQNDLAPRFYPCTYQPGDNICTYIAAQAAYQYLSGQLENQEQLELSMARGFASAIQDYDFELRPGLLSERDPKALITHIQDAIEEQDCLNPAHLSRILSERSRCRNWEEVQSSFRARLTSNFPNEDPERASGLNQYPLEEGTEVAVYSRAIGALSKLHSGRTAGILSTFPESLMVGVETAEDGRVLEVVIFDSHGKPLLFTESSAYLMRWKSSPDIDPIKEAASFLAQVRSFRSILCCTRGRADIPAIQIDPLRLDTSSAW